MLGADDSKVGNLAAPSGEQTKIWRQLVFDDRAELFVLWRPVADGWLVTASLSNTQCLDQQDDLNKAAAERNEKALF